MSYSLRAGSGRNWFSNGMCHTGLLTACEQDQDGTGLVLLQQQNQTSSVLILRLVGFIISTYHDVRSPERQKAVL